MNVIDVSNPTGRAKAVKVGSEMVVIKPGAKAKGLEVSWDDDLKAKYKAAGLEFKTPKPDQPAEVPKPAAPKPVAPKA